jgi:ABC-2 type transport system ATP-binding protein
MLISIKNLTKQYGGGKQALKGINLEINSGMFGLLGPNGAGKTTLMKILVTLLTPTSGGVTVDGLDIQKYRKYIRKRIGYLPQDFSIFSKLKVWEFLDYVGSLSGIKKRDARMDKIDKLLEDVGLFEARDRRAYKLSGGMKRRLGIAQTLIGDPKIMVIDEPTVGLDPEERIRFRNLLADLSRNEMIIVLSTHIVGDISSTCSAVSLLNHGKTIFTGSPNKLIDAARGKVREIYVGDGELERIKHDYSVISAVPSGEGYEVRVVAESVEGRESVTVEPNLEDAYIYHMQYGSQYNTQEGTV